MPPPKRHGPSPWEMIEFHTPGALDALPDDLPDARLLAPAPPVEETQRGYRLLATAVVTQALQALARQAGKDLDTALEAPRGPHGERGPGYWLACLGVEPGPLCGAMARRLEKGETLTISPLDPDKIKRVVTEHTLHGAGAAADESDDKGNAMDQ